MVVDGQKFYPGELASPELIAQLANEYRLAAAELAKTGRRGEPLSRAPFRMAAIHAIELYLNAFLTAAGRPAVEIRGMQHDLSVRTELALAAKLNLRKRTVSHLKALTRRREYLLARYDPAASRASELNRLEATLAELAEKVPAWISSHVDGN
ncbi:hypothetical protein MKP08_13625 [Erythrobacter sp. LQ02-29]|uniref:hypothetical protein n=1 Tax=Erythrobacter sp. LQ02-29 TaxID=2920384 RepID=UPI001F4EE3F2|nr:hypothetical protein [Erythrobacter sp. LQ02-29]MCP9223783.1 hypothetical protein [Erythrobacter sp. LQ02-29]